MAESPLIDLGERHTVTFTPKTTTGTVPTIDPKTETTVFAPSGPAPQPVTLEVFVFPAGQGSRGAERAGLDLSDGRLIIQIVSTEDDAPLKLPDGVSAGDKGTVTLLGQKGTLELQALVPAQIPEVSDENGWLYAALFSSVK